jgi:hypothetical protein
MALVVPNPNQRLTLAGLNSVTTTITTAGAFAIDGKTTLPSISEGGPANSAAVMTITQNSTTVYTGRPGDEGFHLTLNCAAGDVLVFAFTSAAAVDQPPNAVKCVISIG